MRFLGVEFKKPTLKSVVGGCLGGLVAWFITVFSWPLLFGAIEPENLIRLIVIVLVVCVFDASVPKEGRGWTFIFILGGLVIIFALVSSVTIDLLVN